LPIGASRATVTSVGAWILMTLAWPAANAHAALAAEQNRYKNSDATPRRHPETLVLLVRPASGTWSGFCRLGFRTDSCRTYALPCNKREDRARKASEAKPEKECLWMDGINMVVIPEA
jgi:hypothetical protein